MNREELQKAFDSFNNMTVMVIGDVMIDSYMWGHIDRISPEAPVPIVAIDKKENRLGGAANVALNIQSLGATPLIHAVLGNDGQAKIFDMLLKEQGLSSEGIINSDKRITTCKTRVLSGGNQVLRVDEEITTDLSEKEEALFLESVLSTLDKGNIDIVIFEDYDKGQITENIIDKVVSKAEELGVPTAVDPKKKNFSSYKNVSLFKPNLKELKEGIKVDLGSNLSNIDTAAQKLKSDQNIKTVLVTLSELGVYVCDNEKSITVPAYRRDIADVSGAGDTVISVAALCYALNMPSEDLAALSNLAGGLVCEKVGVVPIEKEQLFAEAQSIV